ncbi:metal-sensitive transcriptional regulator [Vagococcus xieshaowenii]|uniref:Metal-sensitive transcriptional regulator n=1 Tax=Vagococcus xieshaowenii TaxID=2562451 RepID=A0AAJ5JQ74_9ENTE|nr:metal-sensitive transcriptional regulator [Vagococcus xieshaowenii]QCA27881.1 metal-sensitive transcriptional regulator [Vagococcus xieshaowenii]TFZ39440.1 metal-sensitive transcriptional regulator [Vagococcus xieshaowenii]
MKCDEKIMNRMKRAEGQMRGIQKMMEEGKECYDIMIQLSAVRSSIESVMGIMVAENMKDCFEHPLDDKELQSEKIEQAMKMIKKL